MFRLRELRREKKISQQTLADYFGITQASLSAWENDRTQWDIETLTKLADYFNVSVDYLLGETDTREKYTALAYGGDGESIKQKQLEAELQAKKSHDDEILQLKLDIIDRVRTARYEKADLQVVLKMVNALGQIFD